MDIEKQKFRLKHQMGNREKGESFARGAKSVHKMLTWQISILLSAPSLGKWKERFGHCIHKTQYLLENIKCQDTPSNRHPRRTTSNNKTVIWRDP